MSFTFRLEPRKNQGKNIGQILMNLFHFMHAPENISSAADNGITKP